MINMHMNMFCLYSIPFFLNQFVLGSFPLTGFWVAGLCPADLHIKK